MLKTLSLLAAIGVMGALASGCANMGNKFGRGMSNTYEIVRWGELRRTMEQTSLFYSPDVGSTGGFVRGFGRSLARTGIGVYEMVTAPFPPYGPVCTNHYAPNPVYPDNYKPGLVADSMYDTDTYVGYSGGDVMPNIPGSRFRVFDSH